MVLDTVKPLYFKVNECMERYELDGRNSNNIVEDFYDSISREFNNEAFTPYSRPLPDLHDDFAEAMPLPFSNDYTMTPEKAKSLIANMKPRIIRIAANYEQSGNGDCMKGDQEDKDDASGRFNLDSCIAGNNKKSFLLSNDAIDLLYWWHVLEDEGMLHYTLGILPDDVGATTASMPSVLTMSSEKPRGRRMDDKEDNGLLAKQIGSISKMWENENSINERALDIGQEKVKLDSERIQMKRKQMAMDHERTMIQKRGQLQEFQRELWQMEDSLDNESNEVKRRRIERRMDTLNQMIADLTKTNNDE
jgi:hypothetical protein